MSSRSKGRYNERRTQLLLEADGWLVERVKGGGKFQKSVDFFGLWDLIAVRSHEIVWVQVKTNRLASPSDRAAMTAFPAPGDKILVVWYDRVKTPRMIRLAP